MDLVRIRALAGFTAFDGNQMIVFNPAKRDADGAIVAAATEADVPANIASQYVDCGRAEYVDAPIVAPASPAPDEGGAGDPEPAYEMRHVGGGYYEISGPGIDPPARVHGKSDAMTFVEEAKAAYLAGVSDASDAPVD